jgi:hypothetical protein
VKHGSPPDYFSPYQEKLASLCIPPVWDDVLAFIIRLTQHAKNLQFCKRPPSKKKSDVFHLLYDLLLNNFFKNQPADFSMGWL